MDYKFKFNLINEVERRHDELYLGAAHPAPPCPIHIFEAATEQASKSCRAPKLRVMMFFTASTSHQITRNINLDGRKTTYSYLDMEDSTKVIAEVTHPNFAPTTGSATTFTLFSKLPYEIRMMIWRATMEDRTVELRISHYKVKKNTSPRYDLVGPYPTILKPVCKEARAVGVRLYTTAAFEMRYKCTKGITFNFELDTLHLRGTQWYNWFFQQRVLPTIPGLDKVKMLSVTHDFLMGDGTTKGELASLLLFPSLEKVTLCGKMPELGDAVKTHPGGCHAQGTGGSCFINENEVVPAVASAVRKEMYKMETGFDFFMSCLRSGDFGEVVYGKEGQILGLKDVKIVDGQHMGYGWKMPEVVYKVVCDCGIPDGKFNIPLLDRFQRRWSIPTRG